LTAFMPAAERASSLNFGGSIFFKSIDVSQ
jgi:hypothetical protein